MSNSFLSHACLLRDKLLEAVTLDNAEPLPPVPGKHPESGAFCPSRVEGLLAENQRHTEKLLQSALAAPNSDRLAIMEVAEALEALAEDAREAGDAGRDVTEEALRRFGKAIQRAQRFANATPDPAADAAIFNPKAGTLQVGKRMFTLVKSEKYVLAILVEHGTATLSMLQAATARPDRILKTLCDKYPVLKKYIVRPGGPGKGGYSTTIRLAQSD